MNNIGFENLEQTARVMKENPELSIKKWYAHVTWKNGIQNEASIRNFNFMMDEPSPLGGTDIAPNPVEYLIAAAASCFAITFEVLVSQQGIKIESIEADIEADLNAAVFLGLQEGNGGILNPVIKLKAVTSASQEQVKEPLNSRINFLAFKAAKFYALLKCRINVPLPFLNYYLCWMYSIEPKE